MKNINLSNISNRDSLIWPWGGVGGKMGVQIPKKN